jgi:long-subunit fatty acid transport protein
MKLEKIVLLAVSLMATSSTYAQYTADALRFSQFENAVDARFGAMGGAKAAIGGDISSVYGNPGGLGMFSKSEFSLTPQLNLSNNKITTNGLGSETKNNYLDLSNVGVVFHTRTYKSGDTKKGLLSLNFGIGYQKRAQFKDDFSYSYLTNGNGLGDFFAETASAENRPQENLIYKTNGAAYDSFLIDTITPSLVDYRPNTYLDADQVQTVRRTGGSSDVNFSIGTNISNKLFIGASLGLSSFSYTSTEITNEKGLFTNPNNGQALDYDVDFIRDFDTEGSGVNLKLGAILKPSNELRIGLSFESPTWFSVRDNYSETLYNNIDPIDGTDSFPFEYDLRTPLKLNGGLAYFIGNKGFISADIGFVDYATIKFSSNDAGIDNTANREIKERYQNTINYSIGGEYKLDKSFLLRAGFHSTGNPYKNLEDKDYTVNSISAGVGYRFGSYYLDAALINSNSNLKYSNYMLNAGNEPTAAIDTRTNKIALTFGVRF